MIRRLNHAVLWVRDARASAEFYTSVLGFEAVATMGDQAVFLRAGGSTNDHDLGLFEIGSSAGASAAGQSTVGLYHIAWEVDTLDELERIAGKLTSVGALVGASDHGTTKALYGRDPDGLEFEVSWLVPAALLTPDSAMVGVAPLDLALEKQRYGGTTPGGIGVSVPVPA